MDDDAKLLHRDYLPVTEAQLDAHFATLVGDTRSRRRFLTYYRNSLENLAAFDPSTKTKSELLHATTVGRQIEKDERFWVAGALLGAFYPDDDGRVDRLSRLLSRAFDPQALETSGLASWEEALAGPLALYFEVNVPSPESYRSWLKDHLDERIIVPYRREVAKRSGSKLEGSTKLDAVLICGETGVAIVFEAKVLSDVSTMISNDVLRNQLARTIDVVLDQHPRLSEPLSTRRPDRTFVALLTPRIFQERPDGRLYGRLYHEYRAERTSSLLRDLPHREGTFDPEAVAQRLGWLTYEDCKELVPGSCNWLR